MQIKYNQPAQSIASVTRTDTFAVGVLLIGWLVIVACNQTASVQQPKKLYFYLTKRMQLTDNSRQYIKRDFVDTLRAENDSVAFWQAVQLFAAGKKVDRFLQKNGRVPIYTETDYDVLDSAKRSIKANFSREEMIKAETYIMEIQ